MTGGRYLGPPVIFAFSAQVAHLVKIFRSASSSIFDPHIYPNRTENPPLLGGHELFPALNARFYPKTLK